VAVVLTFCFAGCGGYALHRMRSAGGGCARRRFAAHVAMSVVMVAMAWMPLAASVWWVAGSAFAMAALWFVGEGLRDRRTSVRLSSLHHALMSAVMVVMSAAMVWPHEGSDGHRHGAGAPALGPAASSLLIGAVLLVPVGIAWLESRHRDRWLEGAASLGMALGATAMAVAH